MKIFVVLMAGGVGTRFWPRSRARTPKQVLDIVDHETMMKATYKRLKGLVEPERIFVVTNQDQMPVIRKQIPKLSEQNFIIEPMGRNTAPCIGLAATMVQQIDADGIMVVLPADHLITDTSEFKRVIRHAAKYAWESDGLVTLGINPTHPATGYGYIQRGEEVSKLDDHGVYKVKTFAEKPNLETALRFLESGDFYWNSGMFIWKVSSILKEIEVKLPELHEGLLQIKSQLNKKNFNSVLEDVYRRIRGISIDYGVMQTAQNVFVIPTVMGWSDVGSWEVVYEISEKDNNKNSGNCKEIQALDSGENYIYAPKKMVGLVGVKNLVIVDTGDALLVCRKNHSQDVKELVEQLKKNGLDEYL